MKDRKVLFVKGADYEPRASHIKLVRGTVKINPHIRVLCPKLACGSECKRGEFQGKKSEWFRPGLLLKHHSNPDLQLWSCEGCPSFLLRVEV